MVPVSLLKSRCSSLNDERSFRDDKILLLKELKAKLRTFKLLNFDSLSRPAKIKLSHGIEFFPVKMYQRYEAYCRI